mmetsp:Transcript_17612/g.40604  ORF Transcript_17612/g.40604 Transcript_17612/m.40604 type:complete len:82 (-) Transcript_17612:197-442(-)
MMACLISANFIICEVIVEIKVRQSTKNLDFGRWMRRKHYDVHGTVEGENCEDIGCTSNDFESKPSLPDPSPKKNTANTSVG